MKSADDATEVYLDDVAVNGEDRDVRRRPEVGRQRQPPDVQAPTTSGRGSTSATAPRASPAARGRARSGGLVFRGDCRYPERMAYYGDKVGPLSLDKPLKASGKVVMTRGVTDSTTMFGFFNARDSMRSNPQPVRRASPRRCSASTSKAPAARGSSFTPSSAAAAGGGTYGRDPQTPHIYPDGVVRRVDAGLRPRRRGRPRAGRRLTGRQVGSPGSERGGQGEGHPLRPLRLHHAVDRRQRAERLLRRPQLYRTAVVTAPQRGRPACRRGRREHISPRAGNILSQSGY